MKSARIIPGLLFAGLLATGLTGCSTTGESALASANEPHASLETLQQADVTSKRYPARLVRVDGQLVGSGRRTYFITPGTHELSFELDLDAVSQYEPETGRYDPKPSRLSADLMEKQLSVTFVDGEHYKFGARIEGNDYTGWKPFVIEAKNLD